MNCNIFLFHNKATEHASLLDLKPYGNSMADFEVGLPPPLPHPPLFLDQTEAVRTGKSIFEPPPQTFGGAQASF